MRTTLLILGLILVGAGIYLLFFYKGQIDINSDKAIPTNIRNSIAQKLSFLESIQNKASNIFKNISNLTSAGSKKAEDLKNFLDNAPSMVSSTIFEFSYNLNNSLPSGTLNTIGQIKNLSNLIQNNKLTIPTLDQQICTAFQLSEGVAYVIENPFMPARAFEYHISWGDGLSDKGTTNNASGSLAIAHVYKDTGNYTNTFQVFSSSTTLTASRQVCIR